MADKAISKTGSELPEQLHEGPPFDGRFFSTVFRERVGSLCARGSNEVPVILLHLADGRMLDLCHIELLTRRWVLVVVYRDSAKCEDMDAVFVPYEMIIRIILSKRAAQERHIGFQLDKSAFALAESGGEKG